jgi:hypothetical protein
MPNAKDTSVLRRIIGSPEHLGTQEERLRDLPPGGFGQREQLIETIPREYVD